jgi:hypothetical protein
MVSIASAAPTPATTVAWLENYGQAYAQARAESKMLLVYFQPGYSSSLTSQFDVEAQSSPNVQLKLASVVAARLPVDYPSQSGGRLIDNAAFGELAGQPGAVMIDLAHPGSDYYGQVVSVLPFQSGKYYHFQPSYLGVMLDLPPGTLTQRTMVFAVRIHPEAPASTWGSPDMGLMSAARSHSQDQAQRQLQGHHNWDQRFQHLTGQLPGGMHAKEVVAESWPGEGLMDAAVDCVDSWRQSSGHWSAVRASQPMFGYDMKRGGNGIWYATGLFGTSLN